MPGFNSGNNADLVKTAIDSVFYGVYDYPEIPGIATAETSELFNQLTIDRGAVITDEYNGPGEFEEVSEEEEASIATIRTGNQKTHSVANYKKRLKIPIEFFEDEQHDAINQTIKKVAQRGRTTRDKKAFYQYVKGFDVVTTGDGDYLFSDSHTTLSGDTVDNLETSALAVASLKVMERRLVEMKGNDGDLGGYVPISLLVPPILFPLATEITASTLMAYTTDNQLNYFSQIYPGLKVFRSPFVGGTYSDYTSANTAYYMTGTNHGMCRWVRIPIETKLIPPDTDDLDRYTYKARFREVVGPISWEGIIGCTGAA